MTTMAGTLLLLRLDLRRDRVLAVAGASAFALMTYVSASATGALFDTPEERLRVASSLNGQPGLLALYGPILDPTSRGELAMSKLTVLYALLSTVLYVAVLRRHTRTEEETGRAELVAGTAVGRNAPLAAAGL
ncbi:MAG: hypothetical protein F2667_04540, partial [Actinobacteria bacterium]|nr:hypothetical protein [Actinomycetota bacterium]